MKIVILFLLIAGIGLYLLKPASLFTSQVVNEPSPSPSPAIIDRDDLAGFGIYTNGTFRVFTNTRYHNQSEEIYIESTNPYVIHIKKEGATWGDFFKTLPMDLTNECILTGTKEKFCTGQSGTLKFYINGKKVDNFVEQKIKDGDRALITFGKETDAQIEKQMEKVVNPLP